MNFPYKLGVVGFGNMAGAIVNGAVKAGALPKNRIAVYDRDGQKVAASGYAGLKDNAEIAEKCEYVLLAVKPQSADGVLSEISGAAKGNTLITIMAGISSSYIKSRILNKISVVRCMPNLPCLYGAGAIALAFGEIEEEKKQFVTDIFAATGTVVETREDEIDAVTCVSGSGPAYFYYFVRAMIRAGIAHGLQPEAAKRLAVATCSGAAKALSLSEEPIDGMIDKVCSKGGTTIEAIRCFDERGLDELIGEAMDRCYRRALELSN